mgnify:CR=1 FL=1
MGLKRTKFPHILGKDLPHFHKKVEAKTHVHTCIMYIYSDSLIEKKKCKHAQSTCLMANDPPCEHVQDLTVFIWSWRESSETEWNVVEQIFNLVGWWRTVGICDIKKKKIHPLLLTEITLPTLAAPLYLNKNPQNLRPNPPHRDDSALIASARTNGVEAWTRGLGPTVAIVRSFWLRQEGRGNKHRTKV